MVVVLVMVCLLKSAFSLTNLRRLHACFIRSTTISTNEEFLFGSRILHGMSILSFAPTHCV